MSLKKLVLGVAAAAAMSLGLTSMASAATIIDVGTFPSPTTTDFFYLTSGTPFSPSITANFGATVDGSSTAFDDIFEFTIPQNGVGSGSVSTSFSSALNELNIDEVLINGVSYDLTSTSSGQSVTANNIPIAYDQLNTIEIEGTTSPSAVGATYTGTATFSITSVSAAPEPASWVLMIGGLGLVGCAMRRRSAKLRLSNVSIDQPRTVFAYVTERQAAAERATDGKRHQGSAILSSIADAVRRFERLISHNSAQLT